MLCYSAMQTRYRPLLHLCDGNSTGRSVPLISVGFFMPPPHPCDGNSSGRSTPLISIGDLIPLTSCQ